MDFTCRKYEILLRTLLRQGFHFQTFEEYLNNPREKVIILRHDVDKRPEFASRLANIEFKLGVKASYHFRVVKESNKPQAINEVVQLGHELAYHYEDLNKAFVQQKKGETGRTRNSLNDNRIDYRLAYLSFKTNLEYFRRFYPVKIISMHGSPESKLDNRDLWKYYSYRDSGIICEPYFDIDYSKVLYLTDTGRRWNGGKVNVRDKVSAIFGSTNKNAPLNETYFYRSTDDIVKAVEKDKFPDQVIINAHPQRWTDSFLWWSTEFIFQNLKNIVKYFIVQRVTEKT
jgi:hypothetical protein